MKEPINREIHVYTACVYALMILFKTQPVKVHPEIRFVTTEEDAMEEFVHISEEKIEKSYFYLPECNF